MNLPLSCAGNPSGDAQKEVPDTEDIPVIVHPPSKWLDRFKMLFIFGLVWGLSAWYLFLFVPLTSFFIDEIGWISYGSKAGICLLDGNFSPAEWEWGSVYGELNLPLGKLVIGVPLVLYSKYHDIPIYEGGENLNSGHSSKMKKFELPSDEIVSFSRGVCATVGAFICLMVFILAYWLAGGIAALVAWGLLLTNPLFVRAATRAMTDMPYNLFLLYGVCALLLFANVKSHRSRVGAAVLCGVVGGLATGVKFTGLPLLCVFFALILWMHWGINKERIPRLAAYFFLTIACGYMIILALTPNYWPRFDNFNFAALRTELHELLVEGKKVPFTNGHEYDFFKVVTGVKFQRDAVRARYPQISSTLLPMAEVFLLPKRWSNLYDTLSVFHVKNNTKTAQTSYFAFFSYRSFGGEFLILIGSLAYFAFASWRTIQRNILARELVLFICFWGHTMFLVIAMKWSADRYYLPLLILSEVICGVGVAAFLQWLLLRKVPPSR